MTSPRPATPPRRTGRRWLFAAVTAPLSPLLFAVAAEQNHGWPACAVRHGFPEAPTHGCTGSYSWMVLAALGFWFLALAAAVTGVVVGVLDGRARRLFAQGHWISMGVVGLCAPRALSAYALGYGLGRLRHARRRNPAVQARHGGWQQAVRLYAMLASGGLPQPVFAPDLAAACTVYMDVPFRYSRFFAMDVTYRPGAMVAVGSPGFVAGAAIGRLIGCTIGYARAASLSRRQWRGHRLARVVVTATTTWCDVGGRWLRFDHDTVIGYRLDGDQACVLTFAYVVPLRLTGPSAWCHAVLFAYLRYGAAWQTAPFLQPVQQAAQQLLTHT